MSLGECWNLNALNTNPKLIVSEHSSVYNINYYKNLDNKGPPEDTTHTKDPRAKDPQPLYAPMQIDQCF